MASDASEDKESEDSDQTPAMTIQGVLAMLSRVVSYRQRLPYKTHHSEHPLVLQVTDVSNDDKK